MKAADRLIVYLFNLFEWFELYELYEWFELRMI